MKIATLEITSCYRCPHRAPEYASDEICMLTKQPLDMANTSIPDHCPLPGKKPTVFIKGMRVRYVPHHANDYIYHTDCQNGVVKRVSDCGTPVFVLYDHGDQVMKTGDEPYTAQATDACDLILL